MRFVDVEKTHDDVCCISGSVMLQQTLLLCLKSWSVLFLSTPHVKQSRRKAALPVRDVALCWLFLCLMENIQHAQTDEQDGNRGRGSSILPLRRELYKCASIRKSLSEWNPEAAGGLIPQKSHPSHAVKHQYVSAMMKNSTAFMAFTSPNSFRQRKRKEIINTSA